ncbi:MAG: hypothetical protein AAFY72_18365, partial [Cyanobacteria bacterium J06649_4]
MKKSAVVFSFAMLIGALLPAKAVADEVWTTEEYDVVYEDERDRTAIWSYNDGAGTIFIDGLAGVYTGRESYNGYWVQETSSLRCDTFREGADGEPTYHWGRFEITFMDPDFPSRWHAHFGLCDQEPRL